MARKGNSRGLHRPQTVALVKAAPAFISAPATSDTGKERALIKYGVNDLFPNELISTIGTSSTAKRCFNKIAAFIEADGFINPELSKLPVAPGKTADALLHETANRVADIGAIAWRIQYNKAGERESVNALPVSCVRKLTDGNFIVANGYQNMKVPSEKEWAILLKWTPELTPEEIAQQIAALEVEKKPYDGHLYYDYDADTDISTQYPVPEWVSVGGLADIEADAAASLLDRNAIRNHFKAGIHVHAVGSQYAQIETAEQDGSISSKHSPAMEGLMEAIKELKDADSEASAFVTTSTLPDEKVDLNILTPSKAYEGFTDVTDRTAFKVCKTTGVPPVLIGLMVAGRLGTSQEMNEASAQLAKDVLPKQNMISRAFDRVFPLGEGKNWFITSLAPTPNLLVEALTNLPALVTNQLLNDLTETERRSVMGLGPKSEAIQKEQENAVDNPS